MTQSKDLTAEAHRRGAAPGRGYAIARWLSQVFHPVVLGIVSLCIVGFLGVLGPPAGLGWTLLALALQVIPIVAFFNIRLRQGAYSDDDVSVRHQRTELYLFGLATVLVGLVLLSLLGAPRSLLALLASAALINVLAAAINIFWKISVHSATMGSCVTVATLASPPLGVFFGACAIALGWARVRTRNHTIGQVIAGLLLAAGCVLASYRVFGLM
jgi:membrane-associated phospholipid phosphatase